MTKDELIIQVLKVLIGIGGLFIAVRIYQRLSEISQLLGIVNM